MHPAIRSIHVFIPPILSILIGFSPTSAQLPPEIRADAYLLQVEQAIRNGDHQRARTVIRNISALQEQHDPDLADDFHFRYAKAAAAVGLSDLALESVVAYLTVAGRKGQHYAEALQVMNHARAGSSSSDVPAQLLPGIRADASLAHAEQAIRAGDLEQAKTAILDVRSLREQHDPNLADAFHFRYGKAAATVDLPEEALESVVAYLTVAGRKGQHYAEALELMNRVQMAVSCSGWDTEEYFKTATVEEMTACLDRGIGVKVKDDSGVTPLHRAAKYSGKPEVMKAVLDAGAELEARDSDERTPLHWAVEYDNKAAVKALTEAGANPNVRDKGNLTPLLEAVEKTDYPEVIESLLNAGANREARDNDERRPLHLAAKFNNTIALAALIKAGAILEAQDKHEKTPLHYAVKDGHPDAIEVLLKAGADKSRVKPKWTALHWTVAYNDDPDDIEDLLSAGAKLNARDGAKWRPLHVAAKSNRNPEVIRLLIAAGADLKAKTKDNWSPLHVAAAHNENPDVLKSLIEAGADVNSRAKHKWTPLHLAARFNRNPDVVAVLIEAGADVKARAKDKWTPLHVAAAYNLNPDVIKALIDNGADIRANAKYESTPLHAAAKYNGNPEVIKALIDAGADLEAEGGKPGVHVTPLETAAIFNRNPDIVTYLINANAGTVARGHRVNRALLEVAENGTNPDIVKVLIEAGGDPNRRGFQRMTLLHKASWQNENPDVVKALIEAGIDVEALDADGKKAYWYATNWNDNSDVARVFHNVGATGAEMHVKSKQGTDWTRVAAGVLGAAAIAHAGKDAPSEVTDQALADWIGVMTEGGSAAGTPTASGGSGSQAKGTTAQGGMEQALRNLEAICGEKYWSGFAPNDHARFYCMAAFNDHCALKRATSEEAKTKLRASIAQNCGVLQAKGLAGKCSYCQ